MLHNVNRELTPLLRIPLLDAFQRRPKPVITVDQDGEYASSAGFDPTELIASVNALGVILNTLGTHADAAGLATLATALNGYVDQLEGYTDGLEGKLDTLHTDIATTLASFLDGLEGKLDTLAHTVSTATATIANGGNLSGSISLGGGRLVGIITPAAWTAAVLSFNASPDGGSNYYNIYDDSVERAIGTTAMANNGFMLSLDPNDWRGITDLKFRSGLGAATVAQGASRAIIAIIDKGV